MYLGLVFANIQSSFLLHLLFGMVAIKIKVPLRSRGSYPTHTCIKGSSDRIMYGFFQKYSNTHFYSSLPIMDPFCR